MPNALTSELAALCASPVSDDARARAALHVLDWAGCAVAGSVSEQAKALRAAVKDEARGYCTAIGALPSGALTAVMVNGALGNVLEMDDVDKRAILHPGPVVIPAALAACEDAGRGALHFLDAIVRGYEAVIRVGRAVGAGHYAYWHNTGTCGPFGAAMAAASVLELSPERTAHALALAGTQASGFWQTRHESASMAKQLHTARAAHAGLLGARLAAEGFDGPLAILEGPQGFFAATCPGADPADVLADYGPGWRIDEVSFKPWPACRHTHPAIAAALRLRPRVPAEAAAQITLRTYDAALDFCDAPHPGSDHEARFSLQHAVAVTLVRGAPGLADFTAAARDDPEIQALRARVQVQACAEASAAFPPRMSATLEILDSTGRTHRADCPTAPGDPEDPLPRPAILAKFATNAAAAGLDSEAAAALSQAVLALPDGGDAAPFHRLLAQAALPARQESRDD